MSAEPEPETEPTTALRRPRRDRRRERNRQRLIDATLDLVLEGGTGALTMASIAKRAGVHHPGFYAHFKNVDECLRAAVESIGAQQRTQTMKLRSEILARTGRPTLEGDAEVIERALRRPLEYKRVYLLLAQCRHEQSPIGVLAREEIEITVREITEYIWNIAIEYGARAEHLHELENLARYITEGYFAALIDLLQGRTKDVRVVAQRLARYQWAMVQAELQRLVGTKPSR